MRRRIKKVKKVLKKYGNITKAWGKDIHAGRPRSQPLDVGAMFSKGEFKRRTPTIIIKKVKKVKKQKRKMKRRRKK